MSHQRMSILVGFVACLIGSNAHAHFGETYGFGARASAMAGTGAPTSSGFASLYYNVAGMTRGKTGMSFGLHAGIDDVSIRLKPVPAGYDIPDQGADSPLIPTDMRLRTRSDLTDLPNQVQALIGGTFSLGVDGLRFGFALMTPIDGLGAQQARFADEREQYFSNKLDFELIGKRSNHLTILGGVAYQVLPWLSVGAGLSLFPNATTTSGVYLPDPSQQDVLDMSVTNDQGVTLGFNAGLLVEPTDKLRFGLSFRGENYFRLQVNNQIQIKGFQNDPSSFPVSQQVLVVVNYVPDTLTASAAWNVGSWMISSDVSWARWSGYLNHQGEQQRGFNDTISASLGVEYKSERSVVRAGVAWIPSPIPDQTGRTSYVDNDRVRVSIGAGHPLEVLGRQLELSWHLGMTQLIARDTDKAVQSPWPSCVPGVTTVCDEVADDTPDPVTGTPDPRFAGLQTGNPGFPGWQSFGRLLSFGIDLKWRFK